MAGDQPPSHRQDRELPGFATERICRIWHGGCGVQKSRRGMTEALFCTGMPLFLQRQGCSGSSGGGGGCPPNLGFHVGCAPHGFSRALHQQHPALAQQTLLQKVQLPWGSQ